MMVKCYVQSVFTPNTTYSMWMPAFRSILTTNSNIFAVVWPITRSVDTHRPDGIEVFIIKKVWSNLI